MAGENRIGMEAVLYDKQFQDGAKRYTTTTNQMVATTEQASSKIGSTSTSMYDLANAAGIGGGAVNALNTAMQGAALVGGAMLAKQLATTAWEMGKAGAQTLRMRDSFAELSRQAGGSASAIVDSIKDVTDGTISEGNIVASVNRGILLGLGANADQWGKLSEVARFRSRAMGIDMTQALNDISMGIGRESRLILDNLGIILDIDTVTKNYAATLGKTADQLTAAERKQAILTSVITEGEKQIRAAGGVTEDAADQFEQLDVALAALKTTLSIELVPAVAELADQLTDLINLANTEIKKGGFFDTLLRSAPGGMGLGASNLSKLPEAWDKITGAEDDAGTAAKRASLEFSLLGAAVSFATEQGQQSVTVYQRDLVQGIEAGTDRLTAMAAAYKALETAQGKLDDAIAKAAQRAVDAEEGAADKRRKAHADLMDALDKEEQDHAGKVEDILQEIADVDADLQKEIVDAEVEAAQERIDIAQDMADSIADAERKLAQEIEDLNRDRRYDDLDAEREYRQELEDIERDFREQAADLEQERSDEEAAIREKYKEARIRELVAMGGDEATIRANWTDDMLQGPLKDAQDAELAALNEQYTKEQKELEDALAEKREALEKEYTEEKAQRELEYNRRMEELQLQHARELEEIQRKNAEQLAALEQELAEEKTRLEAAAEEQRQQLQEQLADEEANHLEREAELQRHYDQQMAEISAALAEELAEIQRNLGLELIEITDNATATSQAWRDSFTQQLLDQDQYYVDRLARDALYQQQYQDLFGIHSPSKWAAEMGQALKSGLDIGLTTPALPAGGGSSVTNNRTVNLSMPATINNGMDAAAFRASVLQTVKQAVQYG